MPANSKTKNHQETLEQIFDSLPIAFSKDLEGKYKSSNTRYANALGISKPDELIGKTISEITKNPDLAQLIEDSDNEVIQSRMPITLEETIPTIEGEKKFLLQKKPVFDSHGNLSGLVGYGIDITENIQKQNNTDLVKIARQVAHDIRSPIMSLMMIIQLCKEIPEPERIALRDVATGIEDIANNLLDTYIKNEDSQDLVPILLSILLLQILSEKKYQYKNNQIIFNHKFSAKSNVVFINANKVSFKRMISNIIDDAIESSNQEITHINMFLDIQGKNAKISIENNSHVCSKSANNIINLSNEKSNEVGIGLSQIKEALEINGGKLHVNSLLGHGTEVFLTFPIVSSPNWFVNELKLNGNDIIIVLDDDSSIHDAWNRKLKPILKNNPHIEVKFFHEGLAAINFINSVSQQDKDRVFLFTDYELLNQNINGLDVINRVNIARSILVTSHSTLEIYDAAIANKAKVLPKQLVPEINILIDNSYTNQGILTNKAIDFVVVDDNKRLGKIFKLWANQKIAMDYYYDPVEFLNNIHKYPPSTRIYMDYDFKLANINGLTLADKLHNLGFTNLFLLTGRDFNKSQIPGYLELIHKHKIQNIKALFNVN